MSDRIVYGEKIKEVVPELALENLKLAFKDVDLDFHKDLHFCEMHLYQGRTWSVHDAREKTFNWKGYCIGSFNIDGRCFWFGNCKKGRERNHQRSRERDQKKAEFWKGRKSRKVEDITEFMRNL